MYAKLFRSMYEGSLGGDWKALVTFQQMLVLADQYGVVDMTHDAIIRITGLPSEIILAGIEALERADPKSRTEGEEGRRIVRLEARRDWGWRIPNYQKYRELQRHEERREYMRDYMGRKRALARVNRVSPSEAEAEAEAKAESERIRSARARPTRKAPDGFAVTPEMRSWAKEKFPAVDVDTETEAFKDYTFAGSRSDWVGTWRNWIRKASKQGARTVRPTRYEELAARVDAWVPGKPKPENAFLLGVTKL